MRTAILSDIHGNLEALLACVAHARRQGVDRWAFLGDFVGYGADPLACLDRVRQLGDDTPLAVLGNHDEAALGGLCANMHPLARDSLYWTRQQLGAAERDFLAGLPLQAALDDALLVHASAQTPQNWEYVSGIPQARRCLAATVSPLIFAGHVHTPMLYHGKNEMVRAFAPPPGVAVPLVASRQWLMLVGSVGQPRDGNCAAAYLLFDAKRREVSSFRVPYDHQAAARKIVAAGLPVELARRLETGL
jgi:diadenosine tetraphosphatase ApaH/serine/threonine PP2A family protein phosphatase